MKALPGPLIDRLYYAFDDDMVGYIESREFVCGLSLLCRGDESRKLKFWFEVFDVDKDNMLSKAEMLALVSSLWKVQALKSEMDGEDELRLSTSTATLMTASAELKVLEAENKRMEKVVEAAFRDMGIECGGEEEPRITFEQFQEWFSNNEIALQFLETITRLSNIVLGVRPRDRREEARIVVDLMNQTSRLRAHDLVYVLSNEWWQQWKEFTSYEHVLTGVEDDVVEEAEQGPIGTVQPGPITNTTLTVVTVKGKMQTTALKLNLVPQSDYIIVPEKVWNVLWNWYGGGPMLAREMVMQGEGDNAELLPELYPYTLHVLLRRLPGGPPSKMCEITISKLKTVGELKEEACSRMMIPESAEVRLWDAYEESAPKMLADEAESLNQAKLVPDQKVILEMQTEGGLWPLSETVSVKARGVAPQPGQVGLHNLGNTCFMNSALQCLSHTVPLRNYFLEGLWKRDLNRRSRDGARGELAKSYAQLLELLWIGKNNSVPSTVAPRSFKRTIGKFAPRFSGYQQHDAHELLGVLVDGLHEDLNRIRRKKYFEFPDSGGRPDAEVALECWEGLRQNRDESCIVDLMYGQLCSKTVCDTCGNVSTHFDMFNCLQLPLPQETMTMMEVCVHYLNGVEVRKYGVRVPNNSILVDVGKELAKICPLPLTRMAYCDVRNSYFATHFTKYVNISKVRSLHVYEYATDPAAVSVWVSANGGLSDSAHACGGSSEAADTPVRAEPQATLPPPVKSPKSSRKESSKSKKRKGAYVHVEVIMRYLERLDVYFLTPNKPHVFGTPLLLSIELARLETMSLEDLYTLVAVRAGPVLKVVEEKEGIARFPFRLSQVNRSGQSCASCGWNQFCVGCEFDDLEKLRANGITLAADFPQATMPLYYNIAMSKDVSVDDSVGENRALQNKPITLDECFSEFAKVETLRGDEAVYCSKCKEMRDSQKKMDLFRIPPVLMVQLKRFNQRSQFLTKNGKLVSLPLTLNLSPWVPEHLTAEAEYELYAVLNHFGSLAGGHYVAYAKHSADGRWYCYDDRRCSEIDADKVVTKNAYVLFYAKKGLEDWTWPDLPPPVDDGDEEAGHCRFM